MLPAALLVTLTMLGGVWADVCERHSSLLPLLVTAARPTPTVYAWPDDRVELHCRPSQPGGCRWVKGSTHLATGCRLNTTQRGTITCMRGEETCGSIKLGNPPDQYVTGRDGYRRNYYRRYWSITDHQYLRLKTSSFLCSGSNSIIEKELVCDGISHCNHDEDELNCKPPCGRPFRGEHSIVTSYHSPSDPPEVYPDGSQLTYMCDAGFSFRESLSGLKRTCRAGRWTAPSPVCQRNVALNRTIRVTGQPLTDCVNAVDGDLGTWCMLAPSGDQQALAIQLPDNTNVAKVLVRALSNRYTVALRDVSENNDELDCPCSETNDTLVDPAVSGVRVCNCPQLYLVEGKTELLVRAEPDAFMSLSIAEIVALEVSNTDGNECALLGHPAHGQFEPAGPGKVKLSCAPGHGPSCSDAVQCSAVWSGDVILSCLEASCSQPPAIPNTDVIQKNGTSWRSVAEYGCTTGYALYPAEQNTTSSCGTDGLWSISRISCLPESDIRVVAMKLAQQHERSMAALRVELEELLAGQQQLLARQNSTQHRLSKLERDVAALGLAEGAYLRTAEAGTAEAWLQGHAVESSSEELDEGAGGVAQRLEVLEQQLEVQAEMAQEEAALKLEQQLRAATKAEELEGESAEVVQLSEPGTAAEAETELTQQDGA